MVFYQNRTKDQQGRVIMAYKKMIIELLDKVKCMYTLKRVYRLLEYLYLREEESGD